MYPNVDVPERQVLFLSEECAEVLQVFLDNLGVTADIDTDLVDELSAFFLRDIYRIDQQQRGSVSLAKYAGYWAFWVRKLKPVSNPKHTSENPDEQYLTRREMKSINETLAVYFAVELVKDFRVRAQTLTPARGQQEDVVRSECAKLKNGACKGSDCFKTYTEKYFNFNEGFFLQYITYSMRNRTFGPHHFALLIESLIYSACPIVAGRTDV